MHMNTSIVTDAIKKKQKNKFLRKKKITCLIQTDGQQQKNGKMEWK